MHQPDYCDSSILVFDIPKYLKLIIYDSSFRVYTLHNPGFTYKHVQLKIIERESGLNQKILTIACIAILEAILM